MNQDKKVYLLTDDDTGKVIEIFATEELAEQSLALANNTEKLFLRIELAVIQTEPMKRLYKASFSTKVKLNTYHILTGPDFDLPKHQLSLLERLKQNNKKKRSLNL
jgi:hypothetical protein